MSKRKLKVEGHWADQGGYSKKSCPKIRLKGRWLEAAGFPIGTEVQVTVIGAGVIELRLCAPPQLRGEDFHNLLDRLTQASAKYDQKHKA